VIENINSYVTHISRSKNYHIEFSSYCFVVFDECASMKLCLSLGMLALKV
jgi:hypothetical protein